MLTHLREQLEESQHRAAMLENVYDNYKEVVQRWEQMSVELQQWREKEAAQQAADNAPDKSSNGVSS